MSIAYNNRKDHRDGASVHLRIGDRGERGGTFSTPLLDLIVSLHTYATANMQDICAQAKVL